MEGDAKNMDYLVVIGVLLAGALVLAGLRALFSGKESKCKPVHISL